MYFIRFFSITVADDIKELKTKHSISKGKHTLKFWILDSGVVLQKIIVDLSGLKPSYLHPPEILLIKK